MGIRENYKQCENIIKQYSKSFYYAFSTLPEDKAKAIYAFCRQADDIADALKDQEKLDNLKNDLSLFFSGITKDTFLWRALRDVHNKFNLDAEAFQAQLEGRRYADFNFKEPKKESELLVYCDQVAGSVGRMLTQILATHNNNVETKSVFTLLGYGMQITNILRDIGEDALNGRIYLPKGVMDFYDYSEEDIRNQVVNKNFIELGMHYINLADRYYQTWISKIHLYDEDSRLATLSSALIYREIMVEIQGLNFDVYNHRAVVSKGKKLALYNEAKKILRELA